MLAVPNKTIGEHRAGCRGAAEISVPAADRLPLRERSLGHVQTQPCA